jgi:hypothetical protein
VPEKTHWLEGLVDAVSRCERATVLCRTSATQREVLRAFAARAGSRPAAWPGLEVVTLGGLVAARAAEPLLGTSAADTRELPDDHPWRPLLDGRARLLRDVRRRVARAQAVAAAGGSLAALRPELATLAAAWPPPPDIEAARAVLASPPGGSVFAVGFPPGVTFGGSLSPLDLRVLAALRPAHAVADDPRAVPATAIRALGVPDVAAEARVIAARAREAAAAGARVLVLVASSATGERVQAALARNGVAVADDDAIPLRRHALAAVLAPLLPLFESRGAEPLDAADLLRLTTDPVLSRTAPRGAEVADIDGADGPPRASTRHVRELVLECHLARAPLGEWITALAAREEDAADRLGSAPAADAKARAGRAARLASARVLLAQVRALAARATGSGRLADLALLALDVGLSSPEDRLGRAIVAALRDDGFRPATADDFDEALSGGVGSRRVDDGVQILSYASYDGRAADLALLADLHDKGLARAPAPDPLLGDTDLRALGYPTPAEAIAERLAIARWAAHRTAVTGGQVLGIVARADASGRRVSAPADLALEVTEREDAFGLGEDLPERRDRDALAAGAGAPDPLATQIDAEWARSGVAFDAARAALPPCRDDDTLAEQLARDLPRLPADLRPWLGEAGAHPATGDGLPPRFGLSATRLRAFTTCLYNAFCESVLGLDVFEDPAEDLDPREVGSAVHLALQKALPGERLLVPEDDLAAHRARVLARLRKETEAAVRRIAAEREAPETEPLRLAREGLTARWTAHWQRFVETRITSVEKANATVARGAAKKVAERPETAALAALLAPVLGNKSVVAKLPNSLGALAFDTRCDRAAFLEGLPELGGSAKGVAALRERARKPDALAAVDAFLAAAAGEVMGRGYHPDGDLEVVATELSFGDMPLEDDPDTKGPVMALRLGRGDVAVRGRIDAVLRRRGPEAAPGSRVEVRDFKTGGKGGSVERGEQAPKLTRPQTALYALAVEALGAAGDAPGPIGVEALTLDHVVGEQGLHTDPLAPGATVRIRTALGAILDLARDGLYPPTPHPLGCPRLRDRGAWCEFGDVCRVRHDYAPEEGEGEEAP